MSNNCVSRITTGDIVLLDFPYTNQQGSKFRPAFVLAESDVVGDFLVAYVTSNFDLSLSLPHCIGFTNEHLETGTMAGASAVRVDKVITVSSNSIGLGPVAKVGRAKTMEILKKWNAYSTRTFSRLAHIANRPGDDALRAENKEQPSTSHLPSASTQLAVPYAGRVFTEDEVEAAVSATLDFWLTLGPEGEAFEKELAHFLGAKHSLLVNSGSSANLIALSCLTSHKLPEHKRLRPGDEVITCAAGFPTTVAPIVQNGCIPVFIDNDPTTGNARVEQLEAAYTPGKTKAVMMAHTLGNPFNLAAVLAFCKKYDLWLIEDNCDALGCTYTMPVELAKELGLDHLLKIAETGTHPIIRIHGDEESNGDEFEKDELGTANLKNGVASTQPATRNPQFLTAPTGAFGDLSTQSFYPPHHLTMGEGGAVNIIRRPQLKTLAESFRDWGRDCWCPSGKDNTCGRRFGWNLGELPPGYDHKYIYSHLGYNLKPLDPQAAIGRVQLRRLPDFIEARKRNWEILRRGLADLDHVFDFSLPTHATAWHSPEDPNQKTDEPRTKNQGPLSAFTWDNSGCRTDCSWFGFMLRVKPDAPFSVRELAAHLDEHKIGNRMLFGGNLVRQPVFVQLRKDNPRAFRVVENVEKPETENLKQENEEHGTKNEEPSSTSLPGADSIMRTALFLGTYPGLSRAQLDYEIAVIRDFVREKSGR